MLSENAKILAKQATIKTIRSLEISIYKNKTDYKKLWNMDHAELEIIRDNLVDKFHSKFRLKIDEIYRKHKIKTIKKKIKKNYCNP